MTSGGIGCRGVEASWGLGCRGVGGWGEEEEEEEEGGGSWDTRGISVAKPRAIRNGRGPMAEGVAQNTHQHHEDGVCFFYNV